MTCSVISCGNWYGRVRSRAAIARGVLSLPGPAAVAGGVFGIPLAILTAIGGLFMLAGAGMVMA